MKENPMPTTEETKPAERPAGHPADDRPKPPAASAAPAHPHIAPWKLF